MHIKVKDKKGKTLMWINEKGLKCSKKSLLDQGYTFELTPNPNKFKIDPRMKQFNHDLETMSEEELDAKYPSSNEAGNLLDNANLKELFK